MLAIIHVNFSLPLHLCVRAPEASRRIKLTIQDSYFSLSLFLLTFVCVQLLSGHEAPICGLSFSPSRALLVSGSWDKTVKLWDVFEQKGNTETLRHIADG